MFNFFAYGTLQLPEVMQTVTGQRCKPQPARLEHFARYRLKNKSFPGIRPEPGSLVQGMVYLSLNDQIVDCLDAFEDAFYHREPVAITISGGDEYIAQTYVVNADCHGLLSTEAWCLEEFRRVHLTLFLLHHE